MTVAMRRDAVSGRLVPAYPPLKPGEKRIRGGSGLGDSIYLRPIAEHFLRAGDPVTVCSDYPDVFLGTGATVERFGRERINVLAHYSQGKANGSTTQWQDVCRSAGVPAMPLAFGWTVRNRALVDGVLASAAGRPLVLVHGGRAPMARPDRFGIELLPERSAFVVALRALDDCYRVRIGRGPNLYGFPVDDELGDATTVSDLLDLGVSCAGVVAQCSFAVPLAECFGRPLFVLWARAGLDSRTDYIRRITPGKVLEPRATTRWVIDDAGDEAVALAVRSWRESCVS